MEKALVRILILPSNGIKNAQKLESLMHYYIEICKETEEESLKAVRKQKSGTIPLPP